MNNRLIQIKEMLKESPNDSFLLYALAKEYEKDEDLQKALDTFMNLRGLDPNYTGLYYHLGKLYEELEQPKKAIATYQEGIVICKKNLDFHALSELNNAKTNLELDIE